MSKPTLGTLYRDIKTGNLVMLVSQQGNKYELLEPSGNTISFVESSEEIDDDSMSLLTEVEQEIFDRFSLEHQEELLKDNGKALKVLFNKNDSQEGEGTFAGRFRLNLPRVAKYEQEEDNEKAVAVIKKSYFNKISNLLRQAILLIRVIFLGKQ